jgi:hypothetical protein
LRRCVMPRIRRSAPGDKQEWNVVDAFGGTLVRARHVESPTASGEDFAKGEPSCLVGIGSTFVSERSLAATRRNTSRAFHQVESCSSCLATNCTKLPSGRGLSSSPRKLAPSGAVLSELSFIPGARPRSTRLTQGFCTSRSATHCCFCWSLPDIDIGH